MRTFARAALLAAFLLPLISGLPSQTRASDAVPARERPCYGASYFVERLSAGEEVAAHLTGSHAARFMRLYNAVPPETRLTADEILVLVKAGVATSAVLRFTGGCFTDYGVHPVKLTAWLLHNTRGQES